VPERNQRTESLEVAAPLRIGAVTVLVIERVRRQVASGGPYPWCLFAKQPHALVVRDAAGLHVVATDDAAMTLDRLRAELPQLDALLAAM
jgi:hypothetical protein